MEYNIDIRVNKSNAKGRICRKVIITGNLCGFVTGDDGYNSFQFVAHTNCYLGYIIKEVKKIQMKALEAELIKFNKIQKILDAKG